MAGLGYALDLHPAATPDGDIDVLATGTHADSNMTGGTANAADEQNGRLDFFRRRELRSSDGFNEGHSQSIGTPDRQVSPVLDFAAAVLLDAHLNDRQLATAEGQAAIDSDDGRTLKAGGNRAIQVLLAGDVDLVHDIAAQHQTLLDGDVHGPPVDHEGGCVIHLVGADVALVEEIDDVLLRLELHQGRTVVLPQLGERGTHMPQHDAVVELCVESRGTPAEHLLFGEELLVNLQPDSQPYLLVIDRPFHCSPFVPGRQETQRS